jgi:hypothetical protein
MMKLSSLFFIALLALPAAQGSGRGVAEATIKGKKISINYGRPSLRGRDLLSMLPVGGVWRLGSNMATEITTEADLSVAGKEVKAGKYSLWVKRTAEAWLLCFHPKTGIWGAPPLTEGYIAELPLKLEQTKESAEQLTISLAGDREGALIKIHWGTSALTGRFDLK